MEHRSGAVPSGSNAVTPAERAKRCEPSAGAGTARTPFSRPSGLIRPWGLPHLREGDAERERREQPTKRAQHAQWASGRSQPPERTEASGGWPHTEISKTNTSAD